VTFGSTTPITVPFSAINTNQLLINIPSPFTATNARFTITTPGGSVTTTNFRGTTSVLTPTVTSASVSKYKRADIFTLTGTGLGAVSSMAITINYTVNNVATTISQSWASGFPVYAYVPTGVSTLSIRVPIKLLTTNLATTINSSSITLTTTGGASVTTTLATYAP
jgi:hypothetical protein